MKVARSLQAARSARLVDTGYIRSSFVPVAQKVQLAYPGRNPEVERALGDAEQRFEQSLSLQVLAAPMERDIVSGMMLPRSLNLPVSFMPVSRRLEAPAATAAARAIAEEEAKVTPSNQSRPRTPAYDADTPENKRDRKARAADQAAAMALQGPSMPWTAPALDIKPRAKRKKMLEGGERKWLTEPLETRRLRMNRARKVVLQMSLEARKARAWTVWYDVMVVPQLSFASVPPREEAHAWPPLQHPDIYFPHTRRDWIFIHPTFVRSIFDTKSSFTTSMLVPNVAPGQDVSDRNAPKPATTPLGFRFGTLERWTRGTPLGPTRPLAGEGDPWMDRPLRLPVTDSAQDAPESAIRELITCYAPLKLVEMCHAALQAEVLAAAGWAPEDVFALFPSLRPKDMDAQLNARPKEPEAQSDATGNSGGEEQREESSGGDVAGADPFVALIAGISSTQIAEIRELLDTTSLLEQAGGLSPGEGFTPSVLSAIGERASSLLALRARHDPLGHSSLSVSSARTQHDPVLLRQVAPAEAVAVHLWRLMLWRHQPFQG